MADAAARELRPADAELAVPSRGLNPGGYGWLGSGDEVDIGLLDEPDGT